jgi:hypothetical protein
VICNLGKLQEPMVQCFQKKKNIYIYIYFVVREGILFFSVGCNKVEWAVGKEWEA